MLSLYKRLTHTVDQIQMHLEPSHEIFVLIARLYIAKVFFMAGYSKISDWNSTLYLFTNEYHVPLLSPVLAAVLATFGELVFSVLLALGLKVRVAGLGLFIVNAVAVISYYSTLADSPAAIHDHIEWGIILGLLMSSKPTFSSVDGWLSRSE